MGRCNRKGLKNILELLEANCYIYTEIDDSELIKEKEPEKKADSRKDNRDDSKRVEKESFIFF